MDKVRKISYKMVDYAESHYMTLREYMNSAYAEKELREYAKTLNLNQEEQERFENWLKQ